MTTPELRRNDFKPTKIKTVKPLTIKMTVIIAFSSLILAVTISMLLVRLWNYDIDSSDAIRKEFADTGINLDYSLI